MSNRPLRYQLADDIVFNDGPDEDGVHWFLETLRGWSSPPVRVDVHQLPRASGGRFDDFFFAPRELDVVATLASKDRSATRCALERLQTLLGRFDPVALIVSEDEPKTIKVKLAGPIEDEWFGPVKRIRIPLVAADHRKYSVDTFEDDTSAFTAGSEGFEFDQGSGADLGDDFDQGTGKDLGVDLAASIDDGFIDVENVGTLDSYPRFVINGPDSSTVTDIRITNVSTGDQARITAAIATGQLLTVDFLAAIGQTDALAVHLDGLSRYSDWERPRVPLTVAPGPNRYKFEVLAGTKTGVRCALVGTSAWM